MINKSILEKLDHLKILYKINYNLKKSSYFQTGGRVDLAVYPDTLEKFKEIVKYFFDSNIEYLTFGATTNCIFRDNTNIQIVVFSTKMRSMSIGDDIYIESGAKLPRICNTLAQKSISGFEELQGVPATLGGAVYMNAGCYGNEISRHLVSVLIVTKDGCLKEMQKGECKFGYRYSIFHEMDCIILSAKFVKNKGNKSDILEKIRLLHVHRHNTLEYDYRNVGSVFVTHDIYSDLAKKQVTYKIILIFIRVFVYKLFRVKTNKFLNMVTFSFFNLTRFTGIVSIKTMNVVINHKSSTKIIEEYIFEVRKLTGNRVEIELV